MKKTDIEDFIIAACVVAILIWILWALVGCSTQKAETTDVLWISSDGSTCILYVEGKEVMHGDPTRKAWNLETCKVSQESDPN